MEEIFTSAGIMALLTLTFLEVVLGIDNIIFISIVTNKLPKEQQPRARMIGLSLALIFRIAMLLGLTWIMKFDTPLFIIKDFHFLALDITEFGFSGRDAILLAGGIFLLAKSTSEIYGKVEGKEHEVSVKGKGVSFSSIIVQIVMLDIVFSFDSILTAIGMTDKVILMIIAVIISIIIMMMFSGAISKFINAHPSLQILALSFLIMIGVMLIADAFHNHVPKGYIYAAIVFSLIVEILNMRMRKKTNGTESH
ncbi:MAG: TerC family protein [Bacteroidetes bacterium]|nr:MAG: TerC family protein [Bacteroidota bacterium]